MENIMKENRLISMVEFVLIPKHNYYGYKGQSYGAFHYNHNIRLEKYANFLNQPLNISMFVPAVFDGGKWVVLEDPNLNMNLTNPELKHQQYQQAKDKVIFEGWKFKEVTEVGIVIIDNKDKVLTWVDEDKSFFFWCGYTIQDLIKYKPTLTKYGQQQSGL